MKGSARRCHGVNDITNEPVTNTFLEAIENRGNANAVSFHAFTRASMAGFSVCS